MKKCGRLTKNKGMKETAPCRLPKGHGGYHSPDLTGKRIGSSVVLRVSRIRKGTRKFYSWMVKFDEGPVKRIRTDYLLSSKYQNRRVKPPFSLRTKKWSIIPEYATVNGHKHIISNPKAQYHSYYKNMPFYPEWNPDKGGALWKGAKWIIENLGRKPGPEWSMDIIEHAKGFWPGNLRWALQTKQIDNQQHRKLGKFSIKELRVELRRHGYGIYKIKKCRVS